MKNLSLRFGCHRCDARTAVFFYSRKPHYNMDVIVVSGRDPETEYEVTLNPALIKLKISSTQAECSRRGLSQSSAWLAETSFAIRETQLPRGRSSSMSLFVQYSAQKGLQCQKMAEEDVAKETVEEEEAEKERKVSSLQRKLKQPLNIKSF